MSVSPSAFTLAPPATGSATISWTNTNPAYSSAKIAYASDTTLGWTFLANASTSGQTSTQFATPNHYTVALFAGAPGNSAVLASAVVQADLRPLASVSPSVARRPDGKIDVFVRAGGGMASMATLAPSGRVMTAWSSLGAAVLGPPAGSWTADGKTLDVFAVDTEHHVIHRRFSLVGGWSAWHEVVGGGATGCQQGNTAAWCETVGVARVSDEIYLFVRGTNGAAYMKKISDWDTQLTGWTPLGLAVTGAPSASVSADARTVTIAAVGYDYRMYTRRQVDGVLGAWTREPGNGGAYVATLGLAGRGDNQMTLLVRGANGASYVETLSATGGLVSGWSTLGLEVTGSPSATWSPDGNTLDVIAVAPGNRIYRRKMVNGVWQNWVNSQVASSTVSLVGRSTLAGSTDRETLLARSNDAAAYTQSAAPDGAITSPWSALGMETVDVAPSADVTPDGQIMDEVLVGSDHQVYRRERTSSEAWSAWSRVDGLADHVTSATVASSTDTITVAAHETDGHVWLARIPRSGPPEAWKDLGGPLLRAPALSFNADASKLDIVGVGTDKHVYWYRQGAWSAVEGGGSAASETVGLAGFHDPSSHVDVLSIFVRATNGEAYYENIERATGSVRLAWTGLGQQVLGAPAAYWSRDARTLDVFAIGADYRIWRRHAVRNVGWDAWGALADGGSVEYFALPLATPVTADPRLNDNNQNLALTVGAPMPGSQEVLAPAPLGVLPLAG